jgi:hypothetical protein
VAVVVVPLFPWGSGGLPKQPFKKMELLATIPAVIKNLRRLNEFMGNSNREKLF